MRGQRLFGDAGVGGGDVEAELVHAVVSRRAVGAAEGTGAALVGIRAPLQGSGGVVELARFELLRVEVVVAVIDQMGETIAEVVDGIEGPFAEPGRQR